MGAFVYSIASKASVYLSRWICYCPLFCNSHHCLRNRIVRLLLKLLPLRGQRVWYNAAGYPPPSRFTIIYMLMLMDHFQHITVNSACKAQCESKRPIPGKPALKGEKGKFAVWCAMLAKQ